MRNALFVLSMSLLSSGAPTVLAEGQATGGVQVTARDTREQALPEARVQVRAPGGELVATGTTSAQGTFSFSGLNPGRYTIEIFDAAGNVVGTSGALAVAAGSTATITVYAAAAGAIAGAGGGLSLFGMGTIGTVAVIGGAAAVTTAAIVTARNGKIVLCHKPAGQPAQTIEVSESSRESHMAHGDALGACPASPSR